MRPTFYRLVAQYGKDMITIKRILNEEFNVDETIEHLERLKKNSAAQIAKARSELRCRYEKTHDFMRLFNKTGVIIERRINKAMRDDRKLESLDAAYSNGLIGKMEYKRRVAVLSILSTSDLLKLADYCRPQAPVSPNNTLPPPSSPNNTIDTAAMASLQAAIANGDTVELQRIMWPKNKDEDPEAPSPKK